MNSIKSVAIVVLNDFTNDSRVLKEAMTLHGHGYNVKVIALHNPPLDEFDVVTGINVHRIKLKSRCWSKRKPVQLIKYLEFLVKVVLRYRKEHVFHCCDLSALPVGVLIKLFFSRSAKVVYDAHEYETEINGLRGIEKKLRSWLERHLIKYVDKVITVSESIANEYKKLYSIPIPALVLNCPPYQEVERQDRFRQELALRNDQTVFLYQGRLSPGRGIELLLEAFGGLDSDQNVIVFMGYGPLEKKVRSHSDTHSTIFFKPAVSPDTLLDFTASADYGILFYENSCLNHFYCSPNKMFEYLMAGIPVLISNLFEMRRLVEQYKLGVVASENTIEGFVEAIHQSLELDYQTTVENVKALRKRFNWEEQEKVLLDVYNELS